MREKKPNRGQGGLDGQDNNRGGSEAIGYPALYSVLEDFQLVHYRLVRTKKVGPVGHYWQQEGPSQAVCPERCEPGPRGGEALNDCKRAVC